MYDSMDPIMIVTGSAIVRSNVEIGADPLMPPVEIMLSMIGAKVASAATPPMMKPIRKPVKVMYLLLVLMVKSGYLTPTPSPMKLSISTTNMPAIIAATTVGKGIGAMVWKMTVTARVAAIDIIHVGRSLPLMSEFALIGSMRRLTIALPSCPIVIDESISVVM